MNDALARASAIRELIASGAFSPAVQPVAEAAVACADELVNAGEPRLAMDLIRAAENLPWKSDAGWLLRLGLVHARALTIAGDFNSSIELLAALRERHAALLEGRLSEAYQIRIAEASNLWGLNRVEEAVSGLLSIRSDLLKSPDSQLLGWCSFHLASAETMRGEYRRAKRFALEAIVSARRSENRYLEALALHGFCILERALCRWSGAKEAAEESLEISRTDGNAVLECNSLRSLAIVQWKRGDLRGHCNRRPSTLEGPNGSATSG